MTEADVRRIVRDELTKIALARAAKEDELEEYVMDVPPSGMDDYGCLPD